MSCLFVKHTLFKFKLISFQYSFSFFIFIPTSLCVYKLPVYKHKFCLKEIPYELGKGNVAKYFHSYWLIFLYFVKEKKLCSRESLTESSMGLPLYVRFSVRKFSRTA